MNFNARSTKTPEATNEDGHCAADGDCRPGIMALGIIGLLLLSTASAVQAQDAFPAAEPQPEALALEPFPNADETTLADNASEGDQVAAVPTEEDQPVAGTSACAEDGMNVQCTEFGSIKMEARRDIRGEPIDVTAQIHLETGFSDRGARWVMFSMRNVTEVGASPVTIGLTEFSTSFGDIVTTRVEQVSPSELNIWVDVLDLPIGTPITLRMKVGATERGAFALETLVLAFDRGYEPIQGSSGVDASLFSFTLLGVNKETGSTAGGVGGSIADGHKLPGSASIAVLGVFAVAALAILRRRSP